MPWLPGQSGNPAGRPKGARGKAQLALAAAAAEAVKNQALPPTTTAAELLTLVAGHGGLPVQTRVDAARALLGFEKARLAPAAPPPSEGNLAQRLEAAQRRLAGDKGLRAEDYI